VEKKTLLKTAFITVLLLLTVAATQFVNLGQANPYLRHWEKEGEVALPDGTLPPTILILSPKNNTAYASNNVSLTLNVSMPQSNSVSLYISEIYYMASWQQGANGQLRKISADQGSINLTDIPEGPRWLEVYAVATGFAETRHEIKGIHCTTHYVGYKISNSSVVKFTIDTTPPSISVLTMENKTYDTSDVPVSFTVNEPVSQISYSLDGQNNGTTAGNTILTGLSEGAHNLTVYATDVAGNIGASETITFTVAKPPEPLPTTLVIAPPASVAVMGVGLLVYFKKRKR